MTHMTVLTYRGGPPAPKFILCDPPIVLLSPLTPSIRVEVDTCPKLGQLVLFSTTLELRNSSLSRAGLSNKGNF